MEFFEAPSKDLISGKLESLGKTGMRLSIVYRGAKEKPGIIDAGYMYPYMIHIVL